MNNITISIFRNQIFLNILNELKLFSKFDFNFYNDLNQCLKEAKLYKNLVIFFITKSNEDILKAINKNDFPMIIITKSLKKKYILSSNISTQMTMPLSVLELKKKIVNLLSKYEFEKNSLIHLGDYIINKNERNIKKNNIELKLTEKEINFLILFSKNNEPINKNTFLKNVWNYSSETVTHTVETHIHRLRVKIFDKFNDNNFIKNNEKGYYI